MVVNSLAAFLKVGSALIVTKGTIDLYKGITDTPKKRRRKSRK